jgi:hypothetical protein
VFRALASISCIYDGIALPFCGGTKPRGFFPFPSLRSLPTSFPSFAALFSLPPSLLSLYQLTAPQSLVPAIAVGLNDLRQWVDAQATQAGAHQEELKVCLLCFACDAFLVFVLVGE